VLIHVASTHWSSLSLVLNAEKGPSLSTVNNHTLSVFVDVSYCLLATLGCRLRINGGRLVRWVMKANVCLDVVFLVHSNTMERIGVLSARRRFRSLAHHGRKLARWLLTNILLLLSLERSAVMMATYWLLRLIARFWVGAVNDGLHCGLTYE
jgi:hypothetical protein